MGIYVWCGILILMALVLVGKACWQMGYNRGIDKMVEVVDKLILTEEETDVLKDVMKRVSGRRDENEHEVEGGERRD